MAGKINVATLKLILKENSVYETVASASIVGIKRHKAYTAANGAIIFIGSVQISVSAL